MQRYPETLLSLLIILLFSAGCSGGDGSSNGSQNSATDNGDQVVAGADNSSPTTDPETPSSQPALPRNIILFIGDGMGFESVRAASVFATGQEESLSFHSLSHQAQMTHNNASDETTDSASAATAIATGVKVDNGVISLAIPGDGLPLPTVLEFYQDRGKRTGLVTTGFIEDATPAAFAAHQARRNFFAEIAADMLSQRPHLLMGGYRTGALEPAAALSAGYSVVQNRTEMTALDPEGANPVAGLFAVGPLPFEFDGDFTLIPDLSEMTTTALDIMDADPDGFFLMIENESIDTSGHQNHIERNVAATVELHEAVQVALDWAAGRTDTLIIVTADHETGGLAVINHQGQGQFPIVTWSTGGHTQVPVPLYSSGPLSNQFTGTLDNTDIFEILTGQRIETRVFDVTPASRP